MNRTRCVYGGTSWIPRQAMRLAFQAGVPAEMHLFRSGRHGSGLGGADPKLNRWPELLDAWLRGLGLLE